jgi:uncharacterized protein (TIGR02646 family)
MIQLPEVPLSSRARRKLGDYQSTIDGIAGYAERVATARKKFSQYNRSSNSTFREIRTALDRMCSGVRRCAYCEDSCADEVEHIKPKDLYPEKTFVWENYLYACGPCNTRKNNRWAVFSEATGKLTEVQRRPGGPVVPPEHGDPVFIDPRHEDPLEFMALDLIDTFHFVPSHQRGSREHERADYTVKVLELNERADLLPTARGAAYCAYMGLLDRYIRRRNEGAPQEELDRLVSALQRIGHRTVWEEMKRQRNSIPQLEQLFDQVPEAAQW